MSIESELRTRLIADVTLSALVVARVYPVILPQDPVMPAISYQRISGPRIAHLAGASGRGRARIQYNCWGTSYAQAQSVAAAVRNSLHGFIGDLTAADVAVVLDSERDDYESDVELYRVIQDYLVNHSE